MVLPETRTMGKQDRGPRCNGRPFNDAGHITHRCRDLNGFGHEVTSSGWALTIRYAAGMEYIVLPDQAGVAGLAADMVQAEIEANGGILLGLAGGSTPRATYEELASRTINWSETTAWMTDERWVSPDDDDSNQKMVMKSLVDPTGVALLAPDTTGQSATQAAEDFSARIVPLAQTARRSITLLGIGTDGHTASLFPGSDALGSIGAMYVDNYVETLGVWRLTATFNLLATADIVVFLGTGESKARMIASIAHGDDVPSARVTAREQVLWLLDKDAASRL
jgi:6-phosphogluconolactonase